MTTRRRFLTASVGAATAVTLSGCLSAFPGDDSDSDGNEMLSDEVPVVEDELLNGLADPSSQVPPRYFAGYRYDLGAMRERVDVTETLPSVSNRVSAGDLAQTIENSISGVSLSEFDYFTGSTYRSSVITGNIGFPAPSGEAIHATGSFDADPIASFFENSDTFDSLGESGGYARFLNERENTDRFTAFGVDDGVFITIARSDVDADPAEALQIEFDQRERDEAPIVRSAPAFANAVRGVEGESIRAGANYALVALGANTGTPAFDEVVRGLTGSAVGVSLGQESDLQRSVTYLVEDMASSTVVSDAYEASDSDALSADAWSFSQDGASVTAEASVDGNPADSLLQTGLPIPGYGSVFQQVNPADLGRDVPPRVFIQPQLDDGTLVLTHAGGETVDNLRVRYVHDGEEQTETWEGPVQEGDEYRSEESVDSDSQGWVVWQPDTVNAAVVSRFET